MSAHSEFPPGLLVVDQFEPDDLRMKLTLAEVEFETRHLKEADYVLADQQGRTFAFERKEIKDGLASIPTRLDDQLLRCCNAYYRVGLIIEGYYDVTQRRKVGTFKISGDHKRVVGYRQSGWDAASWYGKLLSLQEYHSIMVFPTSGHEGTVALMQMLIGRAKTRGWG